MLPVPFALATAEQTLTAREMACWDRHPVRTVVEPVPVVGLLATQDEVARWLLAKLRFAPDAWAAAPVDVAMVDGVPVLVDGHHRATVTHQLGGTHVLACVRYPEAIR